MRLFHARTRFGGLEIAGDVGWDGCTLPLRRKPKASTVIDVPRKIRIVGNSLAHNSHCRTPTHLWGTRRGDKMDVPEVNNGEMLAKEKEK